MVSAKVWWVVVVVEGLNVIFLIMNVLFEFIKLCSVSLYYVLTAEGAEVGQGVRQS